MELNNRKSLSISYSDTLTVIGIVISFVFAYDGYALNSMLVLAWCILDIVNRYVIKSKVDFSRNLPFWQRNLFLGFVLLMVFDFINRAIGIPTRTNPSGEKLSPEEFSPFVFDAISFILVLLVCEKMYWIISRLFSSDKEDR